MKILINSINYHPELTGIGKYTGEMADWLANRGHDVRVLSAPPYYPAWKVEPPYSAFRYRGEVINGVRVTRCPIWVPARPTGMKRLLHLASFAVSVLPLMLWNALRWRPDLVLVIEPPLACAPGAVLSAWLGGSRSWLHVQDFEVDAAFQLGLLRNERARALVEGFERWLMRRFDTVSSISARMLEHLERKQVAGERIVFFPNWVNLDQIRPLDSPSPFRRELGIGDDQIVCLYSGNMGKKQGLEIIVEAARSLTRCSNIHFVLCGAGVERTSLERQAAGFDNIVFLPLQPINKLNELLNMADIHLLPQRADAEDLVMPSKLTNMLASARPVVATASAGSEVGDVVSQAGLLVDPGDVDGFSGAIARLADDAALREELGAAGRRYAETHLDKDVVLGRLFGGR